MFFNHAVKRVMLLYALAGDRAKPCRPSGRAEYSLDRVGERRGVAGPEKQAFDSILHHPPIARYVARDHRQADRHRFEQSDRKSLFERWQDEQISGEQHILYIIER